MSDAPPPHGENLFAGRFVLESEVHAGSMSRVYRALDQASGKHVAIKRPMHDDPSELRRFRQEAEILRDLRHVAIVAYLGHGGDRFDDAYLATEWLDGDTLFVRLEQGRLGIADSALLVRRVAEGLGVAHRARIVHRDVKPANIMLTPDGTPKLLDFGIARRETTSGLSSHSSFAGGTWAYMSPEQIMGAAELGPKTDVFALGCLLFECLSGRPAFPHERSAAMIAKVWNDAPRLDELVGGVPQPLSALLFRLLARDPLSRPRDAGAVAAELQGLGTLPTVPAVSR